MQRAPSPHLINAHFFFVDIVGLTNPTMPTTDQIRRLSFLYSSIAKCPAFKSTPARSKLILPTGDGVAIGFLQGPELPLELAIQLHQKTRRYNEGKVHDESINLRIGIHSGPVFTIKDMRANTNIWGPGIIVARRIMDLGEDDHVLVSAEVAKMLLPLSREYREYLHELGPHIFKHNVEIVVYSAYSGTGRKVFGNQNWPKGMDPRPLYLLYPYIEVNITIVDPDEMLVHYERIQEIQNGTEIPVRTVIHQIATDVPKRWDELNIKLTDESGAELIVSDVEIDKPRQKKFSTTFAKPLGFGDKRRYRLEYDVEEPDRSFENLFLVKCGKFVVRIDYPAIGGIKTPVAYEVNSEKNTATRYDIQPTIMQKGRNRYVAEWMVENCAQLQSFRFEW